MRVRIRNHVNPKGLGFVHFRGEMPELEPGRPVDLEVGCADAQFLFELAERDASRRYVGLEIREELVEAVNRQATDRGVPVTAVFCHANRHMHEMFDEARVSRVFVNFPDPWFKRKQRKRRMVDPLLADQIARLLEPGGELLVQTDVWVVALDALESFEGRDDAFDNLAGEWTFWKEGNPYGVRSWREQQCEGKGRQIWRLRYRRTNTPAGPPRLHLDDD